MANQDNPVLRPISKNQLQRLPVYLTFLKEIKDQGEEFISAQKIAKTLNLSEEQVRKDLALISSIEGIPRLGRKIEVLIQDLEKFLGYDDTTSAVLVGVGHLGRALLAYRGFQHYGLNILTAFDVDPAIINTEFAGKKIFDMQKMETLLPRLNVHIGIITVPEEYAQSVCNRLVQSGVKAIWNFAPVHLTVEKDIIVQNVNMASSLAILSHQLKEKELQKIRRK